MRIICVIYLSIIQNRCMYKYYSTIVGIHNTVQVHSSHSPLASKPLLQVSGTAVVVK